MKAVGERGSWFAVVNGERLPCVHKHWTDNKLFYDDPGYVEGSGKWSEFVDAIRNKNRVILTKDDVLGVPENGRGLIFMRTGYIAIFEVADVVAEDGSLRFRMTRRLFDLV